MAKKKKNFSSFLENPIDYTLLITVLLLLTIGLIMVLSASTPIALKDSKTSSSYTYFVKQAVFAVLGLCSMAMISKIDYRFYKKFYKVAYAIAIILLIAVLLFGKEINYSKRWIFFGESLSFQPSEIVKFCIIIFYAGILTKERDELKYFFKGWIKHLLWIVPIAILLLLEPHMSVTIVILGVVGIMMILAGCKLWQMVIPRLSSRSTCTCCYNNCCTI